MATKQQQMITLDSVVKDYLDSAELPMSKYYKIWNIAFRGMEMLGLDYFYTIRSLKLPVLANKTVELPSDFMQYTKVGVLNNRQELIPLTYNEKLTTYADLRSNRQEETTDALFNLYDIYNQASPIFFNYYNDGIFTNLYGVPSGKPDVGSFKIDTDNGVILLTERFAFDNVVLEYIASPQEGQDYYVPVQFREALIAFCAWQDIANLPSTRRGSISDKEIRRREYYNERRLAYARYKPLYLEQAYQMNLESQRLTVKV